MIPLELVECGVQEQQVLKSLVPLYCYDLSGVAKWKLDDRGVFDTSTTHSFAHNELTSYLIRSDGTAIGFATIAKKSYLEPSKTAWDMHQFFVMRPYRRQGIGSRVAHLLFDLHPGQWEIRECAEDRDGQRFWRTVIHAYTRGQYGEMHVQNEVWQGPVQRFVSQTEGVEAAFGTEDRGIDFIRAERTEGPQITLRRARFESELEQCGEIIKRLPEWKTARELLEKQRKELGALPVFVAEQDGALLGFVSLRHTNPYSTRIHLLAVDPEHAGLNVEGTLLAFGENEARERGAEFLEARVMAQAEERDEEVGGFYKQAGFRPLSLLNQSDEGRVITMVKSLR